MQMRMRMLVVLFVASTLALGGCPRRRGGGGDDDDDNGAAIGNGNGNGGGGPAGFEGQDPGPGNDPQAGNPGDPAADPQQAPEGPPNGCIDIFDCAGTCADADDACLAACYDGAPPNGQAAFDEVMYCYEGACAEVPQQDLEACLIDSCPDELASCR